MVWPAGATLVLIDIRCKHCHRLLGRVSSNFFGVVELRCSSCKITQQFSLAAITQSSPPKSARIPR
jgi:phage FluMu protein Com